MATSAPMGHVEEFLPGPNSSWEQYIERLDFYFVAAGIEDPVKKRAVLLSVCGKTTYALVRSLCMPQTPSDYIYKDIVEKVGEHFTPKPSEIVQRFKFNKRNQAQSETVSDYVAELRRLSEHCGFGDTLDLMLRDRLVCGMSDESVQRRLLAEPDLSFKKALGIAVAAETANRNASALRGITSSANEQTDIHGVWRQPQMTSHPPKKTSKGNMKPAVCKPCFRCGAAHSPDECRYIEIECRYCKKRGHLERVCLSKARDESSQKKKKTPSKKTAIGATHSVDSAVSDEANGLTNAYALNSIKEKQNELDFLLTVRINGVSHTMEVDSGAAYTIISEESFRSIWPTNAPVLDGDPVSLRTWTKETLPVLGTLSTAVEFRGASHVLPLIVIKGTGSSLLGKNWFSALGIKLAGIQLLEPERNTGLSLDSRVFTEGLGTYTGPPVTVEIDPQVKPVFLKCRPIPFALRAKVDEEIARLEAEGVLEAVPHSDWATPIVPVLKKDGSIRICGDYRATVNTAVKVDTYPLPTTAELLASLAGGKRFTKLDLTDAYLQLPVDEATSRLLTINTTRGLFKVKRLPFGVSAAPSIFQRVMDSVVAGVPGVVAYLDDVLVAGDSEQQLSERETTALGKIDGAGLRVKKRKCTFNADSVEFLGFRVDAHGVHPTEEKVTAIHLAPSPKNKQELQAFLGLLNFYSCFLPNKANVLEPLHRLLDKDARWDWTTTHEDAFRSAKRLLQSKAVLAHYDPDAPLVLACDASPYGVGAILSHVSSDGVESPVAFASRTLTTTERNYAHIDKEALSIIFGVQKFHQYLYGRSFKILTDHKPLLGLFHPSRRVPQVMSPRMLRWSLLLSSYRYTLEYRPGKDHINADALSRLPVPVKDWDIPPPGDILLLESDVTTPLDASRIASLTGKDPLLARILLWILHGWPSEQPSAEFAPFFSRRDELSVHKGCILWGSRVVIPPRAREEVLAMLHADHPGIVKMKALGRSYVWWPAVDKDIEDCVRKCDTCQLTRNIPMKAPVASYAWPSNPWSRLHVDFAGPFMGKTFFLLVDAHSKWLEVCPVSSMSAQAVITTLRELFATHGIPDTIVSDNAAVFASSEYLEFLQRNGIRASHVAPYHPASNGQIERYVQTTKQSLKRLIEGDWPTRLSRFLLSQHTTPNATTGASPAELLMGRRLKTLLDRLHPDLLQDVRDRQQKQSESCGPPRRFDVGASVYARNYTSGSRWVPAEITDQIAPLTYSVKTTAGRVWRRHVNQLRQRYTSVDTQGLPDFPHVESPTPDAGPVDEESVDPAELSVPPHGASAAPQSSDETTTVRRSTRIRNPPLRWPDCL